MEKAGCGRKYEGWFEKERCSLPFKVERRRKQDCCWVEVNQATLSYWGYCQILKIGVSHSQYNSLLNNLINNLFCCKITFIDMMVLNTETQQQSRGVTALGLQTAYAASIKMLKYIK